MKAILTESLKSKLKTCYYFLISFTYSILGLWLFKDAILVNTFYVLDGYDTEVYVIDCKENDGGYKVELSDREGKKYIFKSYYNYKSEKYMKEQNRVGSRNVIIRSRFLDKWGLVIRGEWTFIRFFTHIAILFSIIFCFIVVFIVIKDLILGNPVTFD